MNILKIRVYALCVIMCLCQVVTPVTSDEIRGARKDSSLLEAVGIYARDQAESWWSQNILYNKTQITFENETIRLDPDRVDKIANLLIQVTSPGAKKIDPFVFTDNGKTYLVNVVATGSQKQQQYSLVIRKFQNKNFREGIKEEIIELRKVEDEGRYKTTEMTKRNEILSKIPFETNMGYVEDRYTIGKAKAVGSGLGVLGGLIIGLGPSLGIGMATIIAPPVGLTAALGVSLASAITTVGLWASGAVLGRLSGTMVGNIYASFYPNGNQTYITENTIEIYDPITNFIETIDLDNEEKDQIFDMLKNYVSSEPEDSKKTCTFIRESRVFTLYFNGESIEVNIDPRSS